ncbi:N-acetylmannosamine-6-phosphate 2-epimerase [Pelolinea submarina]|uniref:N-acylglucosamine-6-phosphate 2-epimerase n=1 Tax=Pelolinea submarina TaxID=913107 RepID=A0A347ZPY1_9CHLR|nr:putative N-acetylmannosamine-6-phosphate 2-epimerase [Pelolinea submarina]REG06309.1 N-acylglucosamine-6-phosphate 2-epimerase [Pelolinea submarina]BBB47362.1 N-acylglucosamine-6-phosphate 2-epimerase [Pelolinea submarina]
MQLEKLKDGLVVSCYASFDINPEMDNPDTMAHVATSCVVGGACAIRTNLENVRAIKSVVQVPVIGIKKIYKDGDTSSSDFRITPTLKEVEALLKAGADAIAIDGTVRDRYDNYSTKEFISEIKRLFDVFIITDISTVEEGVAAWEYGADMVGTTLSGYTPYSKNPIRFGTLPSPDPDYEIIADLRSANVKHIVAEGRITNGLKMKKALDAGAYCVVVGTSITEPKKIVKTILQDAQRI